MLPSGGFLQSVLANYDPSRPPAAAVVPAGPTAASAVSSGTGELSPTSTGAGLGGAGGLASSPNVPAPGTSIDPNTGLPHTAGLTRAELEARKASAAGGAQSSGLMGGLSTSPNVPAPGTSINPATGQPHTAGLTRAELDAIKAKGQALLDPVPSSVEIRRESAIRQNFAAPDLSGREQAAAQLAGTGLAVPASPTARKGSIVEDIEKNVRDLGAKAYDAVPAGVKELFAEPKGKGVEGSPVKPRRGSAAALFDNVRVQATNLAHTVKEAVVYDPETSKTLQPASIHAGPVSGLKDGAVPPVSSHPTLTEPASLTARRASVLDTVTLQAKRLSQDVQTTLNSAAANANAEGGVLAQVKGFVKDAFSDPGDSDGRVYASPAQRYAFGTVPVGVARSPASAATASVPHVSLPSEENQGARPGEVTGGVGALPGKLGEAGVAVPPEVRATEGSAGGLIATSSPSTSSNTGLGGIAGAGFGAGAIAAALLGEQREGDNVSGLKNHSVPSVSSSAATAAAIDPSTAGVLGSTYTSQQAAPAGATSSSAGLPDLSATTAASNKSYDLAAPLPATFLGTGAAHGATDLEVVPGVNASTASSTAPTTAASLSASTADSSTAATSLLSAPRVPNDRTESLASVTAIRHGHAGSRDHEGDVSPLATLPVQEVEGNGTKSAVSLTPGDEASGVGHPSTKGQEGTSRVPGSYPAANAGGAAIGESAKADKHESTPSSTAGASSVSPAAHSSDKTTPPSSSTPTKAAATPSKSTATSVAASSPTAARKSLDTDGHKRTGSTSSTGKKVGLMQKLKGEVKIISGKMSHDESKITLGEKMKHGEA